MWLLYCRLAQTAMAKNKPTLVVSSTYELWVGNEGHDEITVKGDIMGFHKGDYSEKVVTGPADDFFPPDPCCVLKCCCCI